MSETRRLNLQYKALHGFYWMLYCLPTGYITVFLLKQGISSAAIGAIVAASNILAAAGQLIVGRIADKHPKATWRNLILAIGGLEAVTLAILLLFQDSAPVNLFFFPCFMLLMYFQMPLVNSSIFYYTSQGLDVDFGSARGTGSVTYAIISYIAGHLIASVGEKVIIYLCVIVLAALLINTYFMPCSADKKVRPKDKTESGRRGGMLQFVSRYPSFTMVLIGCILLMAFHNIVHTYMIQMMEAVGGDSATMGTAFSIEALMELPVMFGFYLLIRKFSANSLMTVAAVCFIIKAAAYLLAPNVTGIYLAQSVQMFSYAIFASASVYYANEQMEPQDKVTGQSYMTASISIGAVLGNLLGGIVLDSAGVRTLLFFALALTIAGAAVAVLGIRRGIQGKQSKSAA